MPVINAINCLASFLFWVYLIANLALTVTVAVFSFDEVLNVPPQEYSSSLYCPVI